MSEHAHPYNQLAIVIPCYNCGEAVRNVIQGCHALTPNVLAVNDGSLDDTGDIIQSSGVDWIGWQANQGKGAALRAGFDYWLQRDGWDCLITIDSDGQHATGDILKLMDCWLAGGAEFIVGRRGFETTHTPWLRRTANKTSSKLIRWLTGCRLQDIQSGFRLFSRRLLDDMLPHIRSSEYAIETEMALWATRHNRKFAEVDIQCIYTPESSSQSAWKPLLDSCRIANVTLHHILQQKSRRKP